MKPNAAIEDRLGALGVALRSRKRFVVRGWGKHSLLVINYARTNSVGVSGIKSAREKGLSTRNRRVNWNSMQRFANIENTVTRNVSERRPE
jgi:hypothetical protein